jgi:DNA-directed RNA polymerase subunit RPC12/RpoP
MGNQQHESRSYAPDPAVAEFLRGKDAKCPQCGFQLRGLASNVCPECGHQLALQLAKPRGSEWYRYAQWQAIAVALHCLLVIGNRIQSLSSGRPLSMDTWLWLLVTTSSLGTLVIVTASMFKRRAANYAEGCNFFARWTLGITTCYLSFIALASVGNYVRWM